MISFGDKQDQVFLGRNYQEPKITATAQKIDIEIKSVDDQYKRAKDILVEKINALASAEALLEYETIEGKHIHEILEHGKIVSKF